jgi:hypothetical protein
VRAAPRKARPDVVTDRGVIRAGLPDQPGFALRERAVYQVVYQEDPGRQPRSATDAYSVHAGRQLSSAFAQPARKLDRRSRELTASITLPPARAGMV